jgi:hypothetical protein
MDNNDRIIRGINIGSFDFQRFDEMGITPYYFDNSIKCSLVQVTKNNHKNIPTKMVYLLSFEQYNNISRYISIVNDLDDAYRTHIKLMHTMAQSILVEKILK